MKLILGVMILFVLGRSPTAVAEHVLPLYVTTNEFGSASGDPFHDGYLAGHKRVAGLVIHSGADIDGLQLNYEDDDAELTTSDFHGGFGGERFVYWLQPGEYIKELHGTIFDGLFLNQLTVVTSLRHFTYGGSAGQTRFHIALPEGYELVGFFGKHSDQFIATNIVTSIGMIGRRRAN